MAFPVAVALAISAWRKGAAQFNQTAGPALRMALMLAVSACLLAGVVVSQSRMGFIATLTGAGFAMLLVALRKPLSQDETDQTGRRSRNAWRWAVALALPVSIMALLPTRELILRFADMASTQEVSRDDRVKIWRDTLRFAGAYKWTGSGLGAFEHGFFRYQTVAPVNTVDFAHNDYLQIVAEVGIPGSLLVVALAGWIAARDAGGGAVAGAAPGTGNWPSAFWASLVTRGNTQPCRFQSVHSRQCSCIRLVGRSGRKPGIATTLTCACCSQLFL